jgi:hypothetical protein
MLAMVPCPTVVRARTMLKDWLATPGYRCSEWLDALHQVVSLAQR